MLVDSDIREHVSRASREICMMKKWMNWLIKERDLWREYWNWIELNTYHLNELTSWERIRGWVLPSLERRNELLVRGVDGKVIHLPTLSLVRFLRVSMCSYTGGFYKCLTFSVTHRIRASCISDLPRDRWFQWKSTLFFSCRPSKKERLYTCLWERETWSRGGDEWWLSESKVACCCTWVRMDKSFVTLVSYAKGLRFNEDDGILSGELWNASNCLIFSAIGKCEGVGRGFE